MQQFGHYFMLTLIVINKSRCRCCFLMDMPRSTNQPKALCVCSLRLFILKLINYIGESQLQSCTMHGDLIDLKSLRANRKCTLFSMYELDLTLLHGMKVQQRLCSLQQRQTLTRNDISAVPQEYGQTDVFTKTKQLKLTS